MKKHFFNVIAALALVCGVFAFTGCGRPNCSSDRIA